MVSEPHISVLHTHFGHVAVSQNKKRREKIRYSIKLQLLNQTSVQTLPELLWRVTLIVLKAQIIE